MIVVIITAKLEVSQIKSFKLYKSLIIIIIIIIIIIMYSSC
jgi:hypothetical protein